MSDTRAIAEETARASYGRMLAWLCARTGDVAAAEDALADAFRSALETWPERGVPNSPEAWIITAARRKLIDGARRHQTRDKAAPELLLAADEAQAAMQSDTPFPDERLKLMFICAHPAIDEGVRTPLMLQTVLGLDAARISSAFLTSPKAMGARLVRAKRKIKAATIPFSEPTVDLLPSRLPVVLDAIYAAFGTGWDDAQGADGGSEGASVGLTGEAIFLASVVTKLLPKESEAWGLLALMAHAEARRPARRRDGAYVTLAKQDTGLWDKKMISMAETALGRAWRLEKPGRYQYEAAIQSAHAAAMLGERDTSQDVIALYERLIAVAPTIGAKVGYAAALAAAALNNDALHVLDQIHDDRVDMYQPYWAVRAHLLKATKKTTEANSAYDRAIGLASDTSVRAFLLQQKTSQEDA